MRGSEDGVKIGQWGEMVKRLKTMDAGRKKQVRWDSRVLNWRRYPAEAQPK